MKNYLLPYFFMLLLTGCFFQIPSASAQSYYFKHYQVENGLSNNTVNCSIQGKNGFLWFGTKEGLNRFDGYRFKLFTLGNNENGKPTNDLIYSLVNDRNGTLWVGTQIGLFRFNEEKEKLESFIDSLSEVHDMQLDNNGNLWFISWNNICRYNFKNNTLRRYNNTDYFSATSITKDENGKMWFISTDGFLKGYDAATDKFSSFDLFAHSPKPTSKWLQKVYAANNGTIFIGTTSQGLKQFNMSTGEYKDIFTYNPDKTAIYVRDIMQNSRNEFWFATESGIFILNTDTHEIINLKKKFLDPYTLSDNAVYTLCKDSEGGIWAGTFFGGVNYFPRQYTFFQKYFPDNSTHSISGSAVREICEDSNKNIWIGTEDAGLNKLVPSTGKMTHFEPGGKSGSISYSNIHGLTVIGNELWIGTFEHGIDVMDLSSEKVVKHYIASTGAHGLKSNFILAILKTRAGELYAATSAGLAKYNAAIDNFDPVTLIDYPFFISSLMEDHKGIIWIGTHNTGLFSLDPVNGHVVHYLADKKNSNSLTNNHINAIMEDSQHSLWFSTEGGGVALLSEDRKTFSSLLTKNGLPSNFIFKTIEDDEKNIWISTSKGLVNFHPSNKEMEIYTKANGLLNDQFNYSSGFKASDSTLYFGSIKGMVSFKPGNFIQNNFKPRIFITGIQVHNKEIPISPDSSFLKQSILKTKKITLPYNQSSISLDFAALSFTSPEMTEYSYKMEGLDRDWTYLKSNRKVYFTNLSPGNYTFRVKAASNGKWSETEQTLNIIITPPFWSTAFARMVYIMMGALLLFYIVNSYHRRTQLKKEKEIYEAKIDFFTNLAHEIKTPLTLIKGPVENLHERIDELPEIKEDVVTMERNTNRLIALVTQILDFRQTEAKGFSLDFSRENVNHILEEVYLNFSALAKKKKLNYLLDLPLEPVYATVDEEALNKIFNNLLSNATKYAKQQVIVRLCPFTEGDSHFKLEVMNDGFLIPADMFERIFEPFYRLKETNKQKGTGIGLALARSLAELHSGTLTIEPSMQEMNVFVLSIPLNNIAHPIKNIYAATYSAR